MTHWLLGQREITDQSQSRDGAVLTNKERVFSDPWLTAPRRPEPEHHLSESISGTTRFIPERSREATTTIKTFLTSKFIS